MTDRRASLGFFFSWSGLVLLPFNLVVGGMLGAGLRPSEFVLVLTFGVFCTILLGAPAVLVAQRTRLNFPQSAFQHLPRPAAGILVALAPLVSLGWFTLQTAVAAGALQAVSAGALPATLTAIPLSLAFIAGPLLLGYSWLSRTGALATAIVAVLMLHLGSSAAHGIEPQHAPAGLSLAQGLLLVLGTWVFSSTTSVMDLARFAGSGRGALVAFAAGLILANGGLIAIGYWLTRTAGPDPLKQFLSGTQFLGFLFLLLSLWSTNDANAYSTMQVLERLRMPVRTTTIVSAVAAGAAAASWGDVLGDVLGWWLGAMGWLGVGIGAAWWVVFATSGRIRRRPIRDAPGALM